MAVVPGQLTSLLDVQDSPISYDDSFVVPGAGSRFGAYIARLDYRPKQSYGITITGTPEGGGASFEEVPNVPTASGEYQVVWDRGDVIFYSTDEDSSVTATYYKLCSTAQSCKWQPVQDCLCVPFFISGRPDEATDNGSYEIMIPLRGDEPIVYIQGISVCAQIHGDSLVTTNTIIRVSPAVFSVAETEYIDADMADDERQADGYGSLAITTASQAIYIHIKEAGGHGNINGHVWLRRINPA